MESLLQHLLDLLQDPDTQDTLEETARIYFAGTEVSCDWLRASHVTMVLISDWSHRASPSTSSRASSSAASCCSASSSSSASASSAVSEASGDDYSAHITETVELETQVHTKFRNHGEGP